MKRVALASSLYVAAFMLAGCLATQAPTDRHGSRDLPDAPASLKINELQVLATHNSYSMGIDARLLELLDRKLPGTLPSFVNMMPASERALFAESFPNEVTVAQSLSYSQPDLTTQLNEGVRGLDLDVNPDPKGGHFLDPAGYRLLRSQGVTDLAPHDITDLDKPGLKVLHIPDLDFRSHCNTLTICLRQIKTWSDAHRDHVPIFITLEAKIDNFPIFSNPTPVVPFDASQFDELDREILGVLGRDRIIMPDDVRGNYPTLNAAVRAGNWPTLAQSRGKIIFMLMTAMGQGTTDYLKGHPSLKGRVAFLRAEPGEEHAAFLVFANAMTRGTEIAQRVREGYLVRSPSDITTYEAKVNDMTRANAAFASGAQMVVTDFARPGNPYGTSYVVRLPGGGGARCNPVLAANCKR